MKITDEMIDAAREAGRKLAPGQPGALVEAFGEVAVAGLTAALSAMPAVRVKELVPSQRLDQIIGTVDPSPTEAHDMAVELMNWRRAASEARVLSAIEPAGVGVETQPPSTHHVVSLEERIENARQAASETHSSWEARCHAILNELGFDFGAPKIFPLSGRWLPIEQADKTIIDVQEFPEVGITIATSDRYWVRDEDGRVYEASWSEGRYGRDYWWDFEGESPVDPVEFMPHPLDPRFATTEGSGNG